MHTSKHVLLLAVILNIRRIATLHYKASLNSTLGRSLTNLSSSNFTRIVLPGGDDWCVCPTEPPSQANSNTDQDYKELLKKKRLAIEAQRASTSLTVLLVLLLAAVLYTKMWKNREAHMTQSHMYNTYNLNKNAACVTAAKALRQFHQSQKNKFKTYKHRRRRAKKSSLIQSEFQPLLADSGEDECYSFGV